MIPLVILGGATGTAAREALSLAIPDLGGLSVSTFVVNILGAFLLGALVESLARRGPDRGRRRALRLTLGTGVLGGFTTYSALAVETALLLGDEAVIGVAYALATLIAGVLSTFLGIAAGAAHHRRSVVAPSASESDL